MTGHPRLALALVLLLGLGLFVYGISWGLPSHRGWAGDELIPAAVLHAAQRGFSGGWFTKYPAFHYMVLAAAYAPVRALAPGDAYTALFYTGRLVSVAMALGTLLFLYCTGREISGARAGLFAALITAFGAPFVYYAKTANVEVPYLFWSAAAVYLFVRVLKHHRPRDYALFAAAAALSVATKDQAYGLWLLAPLPIVLSLRRREGKGALAALVDRRLLLALGAGVLAFALAWNLPANGRGFARHVETLTGAQSEDAQEYGNTPAGHLANLVQTARNVRFCLGWPLFLVCAAGALHAAWRARGEEGRLLLGVATLGVSYYLTFLSVVLFSRDRYVLPLALLAALFGGRMLACLTAPGRPLRALGLAAAALALGHGFLTALSVDRAMVHDARYEVETWLRRNAPAARAFAVGRVKHAPRLPILEWHKVLRRPPASFGAHYLAVNVVDLRTPRERQLYERLRSGELGYRLVREFKWRPRWDPLDARGVYTTLVFVNPRMALFRRAGLPGG